MPIQITHRVFVAASPGWYGFFNGPYRGAMSRNYEFNHSIFVPQLDLTTGKVVHFDGRTAPIAAILAHEMTHTVSQESLGLIRSWQTPSWKKEGYAEYIGNPRTGPLIQDLRILDREASNTISIGAGVAVPKYTLRRRYFGSTWQRFAR